jgi:membrane protease YdiL (CAAX protease family)
LPITLVQLVAGLASSNPATKQFLRATYLPAFIGIAITIVAYRLFVRWIEKRSADELAFSSAPLQLGIGVPLGAAMFGATALALWLAKCLEIEGTNPWHVLIPAAIGAAASAVIEEILFRGIVFRITEASLGTWLALTISALLFGAIHLLNPNANWYAGLAIVLEAGIFLAAAYVWSRSLWFVIGAHFAWNFTEGGIFGVAVSGHQNEGLFRARMSGSTLLSGGAFGAETSVIAIAICLAVAIALLILAKRKGRFVKPYWKRSTRLSS